MNKDNILAVADAIEKRTIPDLGFNMGDWTSAQLPDRSGHNCGTTACIGGWTDAVFHIPQDSSACDRAQRALDLTDDERNALFYPKDKPLHVTSKRTPYEATASEAVAVLRHLAETGEVDWSILQQ